MKLTAFVMATIQMIVTGMDSQPRFRYVASEKTFGFEMNWILQPCQTATPAAAIAKLPYQILQALVGAALGLTALSMVFAMLLARRNDKKSKSAAADKKEEDLNG